MHDAILFACFFFTIPTLLVVVVELYGLRGARSPEDISFWTWTFTNPAGVVLLPLFIYFILLLENVSWKFEDLTTVNITASLGIPLIFTGILAVNSYIFRITQEASKVGIAEIVIARIDKTRLEDKAEFEKKLAEMQAARAENKAEFEKKLAEDKAISDRNFERFNGRLDPLTIDKAVQEELRRRGIS